jgi:hypothetical protein
MGRAATAKVDCTYRYEFGVDSGAVGAVPLRGPNLPAGAVIVDALLLVDTVPTSGGAATMRLDAEASGDVQAAAAISGAPWATVGAKRVTLTATSAPVRLATVDRQPNLQIATAALTAGKFRLLLSVVELV